MERRRWLTAQMHAEEAAHGEHFTRRRVALDDLETERALVRHLELGHGYSSVGWEEGGTAAFTQPGHWGLSLACTCDSNTSQLAVAASVGPLNTRPLRFFLHVFVKIGQLTFQIFIANHIMSKCE